MTVELTVGKFDLFRVRHHAPSMPPLSSLHVSISHPTHRSESCHKFKWVIPHMWISHATWARSARPFGYHRTHSERTKQVPHINQWHHASMHAVTLSCWCMCHVIPRYESCHTYEWDMPHILMSHVTPTNAACHAYTTEYVTRGWTNHVHPRMRHVTPTNAVCHTYRRVMFT